MKRLVGFFLGFIWASLVMALPSNLVYRVAHEGGKTRLVFETQDMEAQVGPQFSNTTEIFFSRPISLPKQKLNDSLIEQIVDKGEQCTVYYLQPVKVKSFKLLNPNRLVLDIEPLDEIAQLLSASKEERNDSPLAVPATKNKSFCVVLDAGHGGKDSGAVGFRRSLEKELNLRFVQKIAHYLSKTNNVKVVFTRSTDRYLYLNDRLKIARKYNADLFVSIHADAFYDKQAKGASVFALSPQGASSAAARWLAQKENESELGRALADKDHAVRSLLLDLAQTVTSQASLKAGNCVLKRIRKVAILHSTKVEQAAFLVLKAPEIPSLLIETGFISNREEEKLLLDKNYQDRLAYQIAQGIIDYFNGHANS